MSKKIEKIEHDPPEWLKQGAFCYCLGEAYDVFIIGEICKRTRWAFLYKVGKLNSVDRKLAHGWEFWHKLRKDREL
jgi:hypothetical protein